MTERALRRRARPTASLRWLRCAKPWRLWSGKARPNVSGCFRRGIPLGFRRLGAKLRLAVLWCESVAIGFQHVVWAEDDFESFTSMLRGELSRYAVTLR